MVGVGPGRRGESQLVHMEEDELSHSPHWGWRQQEDRDQRGSMRTEIMDGSKVMCVGR